MAAGHFSVCRSTVGTATTWKEKFALDVWYLPHWSIRLDLRILLRTVAQVMLRRGVTKPRDDTTEYFKRTAGLRRSSGSCDGDGRRT